jgi:hypothetical protein
METLLFIIAASAAIGFGLSHQKRKNDMRLMAKILADREGREERWKEAAELDDALRTDDLDVRDLHKERFEAEERFIEYFRDKYGPKR